MAKTKMNHKKNKKKIALITAMVLIAAIMLGGAYAWMDFSQSFINRFRGGVTPDILLHDDFEPWKNKDVYVENPGEQDMYVRVQFKEFLQIGNVPLVGTDADDKETWEVHEFAHETEDFENCGLPSHNYFEWEMTGEQKLYLKGTSEQGNEDYRAMVIKIAEDLGIDLDGVNENSPDSAFKDLIEEDGLLGPNGQKFGLTELATSIVLLSEYLVTPPSNACWILDDTPGGDGWCYWSVPLVSGQATNLLLDNVLKTDQLPDDNYNYMIDVQLQATNKTELGKFLSASDISTDAESIWDIPEVEKVHITSDEAINSGNFLSLIPVLALDVKKGTTGQLYSYVEGDAALPNVMQKVYWKITSVGGEAPTGVTFDQITGKITVTDSAVVDSSFTVEAYSYYDTSVCSENKITVTIKAAD